MCRQFDSAPGHQYHSRAPQVSRLAGPLLFPNAALHIGRGTGNPVLLGAANQKVHQATAYQDDRPSQVLASACVGN